MAEVVRVSVERAEPAALPLLSERSYYMSCRICPASTGGRHFAVFVFALGWIVVARPEVCSGTESNQPLTLEGYLKQQGYEGLDFINADHKAPLIEGVLSNGRKARLLVDTGWSISTLSPGYARGLKTLGALGTPLEDPVLGIVTNQDIVLVDKLVLADRAQFSNQPARVKELKADYIMLPFDGVLGLDFLLRNNCLIDCWRHRLYVRAGELPRERAEVIAQTLRLSGFSEVRLSRRRGALEALAEINGHPTRLLVDTGAPFNLLDQFQFKELGLTLVRYNQPSTGSYIEHDASTGIIGTGAIGLQHADITKLDSFELGERKWKNVYFAVVNLKKWGAAAAGTPHEDIKGFLAQEFLAQNGALIDVSGGKLWLRGTKPVGASR
jgi:Aspartyl protease